MDNPDVGTIILHRMAKVDGLTISVVSALAPKDARRAYEKGRDDEAKNKLDDAQKNFEKAVSVYPQYSSAWFELGRIDERGNRIDEARKAYQQAIAAEPKFILPHEQLSWLALREAKWQELVDMTDKWLVLDSQNSPDAYYLSSIGNLQIAAFRRRGEKLPAKPPSWTPARRICRARATCWVWHWRSKHDFTAMRRKRLRSYLGSQLRRAKDRDLVQKQLEQIQAAAQEKVQSEASQSETNQAKPQ